MKPGREPEAIQIELIRSLFEAFVPSIIMTIGFVVCGALAVEVTDDSILLALLFAGTAISVPRLAVGWYGRQMSRQPNLTLRQARMIESWMAAAFLAFALVLGLFGARAIALPHERVHMLIVCLIMGYGAGIAVSIGLRPLIAVPCMVLAVLPPAIQGVMRADPLHVATAAMMLAFLGGGMQSLSTRYRRAVHNTARRLTLATLARKDNLTDLPNRLALREWFDENVALVRNAGSVAVHCLDLNGFKPVNDTHGHATGDALLMIVGQRLANMIRGNDIAARLGGDEFVVVQRIVYGPEEADALARRIAAAIAQPYQVGDLDLRITTSIGYVLGCGGSDDLDHLLTRADEALYSSKRLGRPITRYSPVSLVA